MGKKKNRRWKKRKHVIRLDPRSNNEQSKTSERTCGKARTNSPHGVETRLPLGDLRVNAVIDSSEAEEDNRIFGFACPDCRDYEMALAENALEFYQQHKQDAFGFEVAFILGVYFKYPTREACISGCENLCHISFCAQVKNDRLDNVPKKWLFAIVEVFSKGNFATSSAEILDPYDEEVLYGCVFCPPHALFPHPHGTDSHFGDDHGAVDAKSFCHHHKCEEEKEEGKKNEKWHVSRLDLKSENEQSKPSERSDKDGIHFPLGVEKRRPMAFACSDCMDFQLDLAESALQYYEYKVKDGKVFEVMEILAACFLRSWPRFPSSRFMSTDKCHLSFSAKFRNDGQDDGSLVWFFAELIEVDCGDFRPVCCKILIRAATTPSHQEIFYGCGFCPMDKKFPHPHQEGSKILMKHPGRVSRIWHRAANFKHHHSPVRSLSGFEAARIALTCCERGYIYEVKDVVFLEKMPFFWVEVEGSSTWYHVGFTATSKPGDTVSCGAPPKYFFGELKFVESLKNFVPTCCSILEEARDSELKWGCGFCPPSEQFSHPSSGYSCGAWEEIPPLLFTDDSVYDGCGSLSSDDSDF